MKHQYFDEQYDKYLEHHQIKGAKQNGRIFKAFL